MASKAQLRDFLLLAGAGTTPHSGYTLWDHLSGVSRILGNAGAPGYLSDAGLFHSIYGTKVFSRETVSRDRREEIQALIGARAEEIVWLFSILPRPRLLELTVQDQAPDWSPYGIEATTRSFHLTDLVWLECANLIEQRRIHEFPFLAAYAQGIGMLDEEGFFV